MARLSLTDAEQRIKGLSGWTLDGDAIRKQFTFRRFSRGDRVRQPPGAPGRGRRSPSRHSDQLQARDADVFDPQRGRTDRERLRRRRHWPIASRDLKRTYSSREVAALTGLTARQLQLWDAGGLLSPAIPSHKTSAGGYTERRYTPIELFELLVLADLGVAGSPSISSTASCAVLERPVRDASVRGHRRRRAGAAADRRAGDLRAHRDRRSSSIC